MKTVIEMAQEAGGYLAELPNGDAWLFNDEEQMERFAELVRADEREACAEICDRLQEDIATEPKHCAEQIRARGNT